MSSYVYEKKGTLHCFKIRLYALVNFVGNLYNNVFFYNIQLFYYTWALTAMLIAIKLIALTSVSVHLFEIRTKIFYKRLYHSGPVVIKWQCCRRRERRRDDDFTVLNTGRTDLSYLQTSKQATHSEYSDVRRSKALKI